MFDSVSILLLVGAAQGVVLALILATIRSGNRAVNLILSAILMLFSISIVLHTLVYLNTPLISHEVEGEFAKTLFLLISPFFYFYVHGLTAGEFRFKRTDWPHFIPFVSGLCLFILLYFRSLPDNMGPQIHTSLPALIVSGMLLLQAFFYTYLVMKALRNHYQYIKETFSPVEKINLNWLRILFIGYIITWVMAGLLEGVAETYDRWNYFWILVAFFMYAIGYMGLRQPVIFSGEYFQSGDVIFQ